MKRKIDAITAIISAIPSYNKDYPDVKKDNTERLYVPAQRNGKTYDYARIDKDGTTALLLHHSLKGAAYIIGNTAEANTIHLCISFFDGIAIHKKTKEPVAVAFTERNADAAERWLQKKYIVVKETRLDFHAAVEEKEQAIVEEEKPAGEAAVAAPVMMANSGQSKIDPYIASLIERAKAIVFSEEALMKPINPPSWLIRDFIPRGKKVGLLVGPSGIGKTFVGLDMCLHIAAGMESWHGSICHQAKVLYVAGESEDSVNIRVASFNEKYGDAFKDNFYAMFLDTPLSEKEGFDTLRVAIDYGIVPFIPDLIVFDTFNCFFSGDENDAGAIGNFKMTRILRLQHLYGCNIMFVHHTMKSDGTKERGSGAIKGLADYMILVNTENPESGDIELYVKVIKNRNAKEGTTEYCWIKPVSLSSWPIDEDGYTPEGAIIEHISSTLDDPSLLTPAGHRNLDLLLKAIKEYGTQSPAGEWSITGPNFRKYLSETLEDGEGKSDKLNKSTCLKGNRFFPPLTKANIVKLKTSDKHIEDIIIISERIRKQLSESNENASLHAVEAPEN